MKNLVRLYLFLFFIFCQCNDLLAGPGGRIAREIVKSPWGRFVLIVTTIVLLPVILFWKFRLFFTDFRTKRHLKSLARFNANLFDELEVRKRVKDVFLRVHQAWSKSDLEYCSDYMSSWFWQNQQLVFLDQWENQGLHNVCNVEGIARISFQLLKTTNNEDFSGSKLVVLVTAKMEDYLIRKKDNRIMKGSKGYRNVETIWIFIVNSGDWVLDDIDDPENCSIYSKMSNEVIINENLVKG